MLLGGWRTSGMLDKYLQKDTDSIKAAVKRLDEYRNITKDSQKAGLKGRN